MLVANCEPECWQNGQSGALQHEASVYPSSILLEPTLEGKTPGQVTNLLQKSTTIQHTYGQFQVIHLT